MINEVFMESCMIGMKKYPDKYFDLAICDIPYGIGVAKMAFLTETKTTVKQKNGKRINGNRNKDPYTKKDWDSATPEQEYFDELVRISKHQIIFGIEYVKWKGVGKGRILWNKGFSDKVSFKTYEVAYCSLFNNTIELPLLWAGMQQAKSLREPMIQQGNKRLNEKRIHPCHKPILLYKRLILDYGFKGCNIVDTHVGGGSIRIAANELGCNFTGWEIDQEYWEKQQDRYEQYLRLKNVQRQLSL